MKRTDATGAERTKSRDVERTTTAPARDREIKQSAPDKQVAPQQRDGTMREQQKGKAVERPRMQERRSNTACQQKATTAESCAA
jgi:hypothetical protein